MYGSAFVLKCMAPVLTQDKCKMKSLQQNRTGACCFILKDEFADAATRSGSMSWERLEVVTHSGYA